MSTDLLVGIVVGVALGAVIDWLVNQSRQAQEMGRLREALARLETKLEAERKRFEDSQKVLTEAETRFRETFQALSSTCSSYCASDCTERTKMVSVAQAAVSITSVGSFAFHFPEQRTVLSPSRFVMPIEELRLGPASTTQCDGVHLEY